MNIISIASVRYHSVETDGSDMYRRFPSGGWERVQAGGTATLPTNIQEDLEAKFQVSKKIWRQSFKP